MRTSALGRNTVTLVNLRARVSGLRRLGIGESHPRTWGT